MGRQGRDNEELEEKPRDYAITTLLLHLNKLGSATTQRSPPYPIHTLFTPYTHSILWHAAHHCSVAPLPE
jgi:hypothetical protein